MENITNENNEIDNESIVNDDSSQLSKLEIKQNKKAPISFEQELFRKGIHLVSLSIPIVSVFLDKGTTVTILLGMAILAVVIDITTKTNPFIRDWYLKYFGSMLRKHERKRKKIVLNGASWVLISAVITYFFFPKTIAIVAFTILIICDLMAALIGRKFGKHKLFKKSWEGTIAFFVFGFMITTVYGQVFNAPLSFYIAGFIGSILSGFVEVTSKEFKIDDNLSIPISAGIAMWIVNYWAEKFGSSFINLIK